jgi:hypothetical protein
MTQQQQQQQHQLNGSYQQHGLQKMSCTQQQNGQDSAYQQQPTPTKRISTADSPRQHADEPRTKNYSTTNWNQNPPVPVCTIPNRHRTHSFTHQQTTQLSSTILERSSTGTFTKKTCHTQVPSSFPSNDTDFSVSYLRKHLLSSSTSLKSEVFFNRHPARKIVNCKKGRYESRSHDCV